MPRLSSLSSLPLSPILKKTPYFATITPSVSSVSEGRLGGTVTFNIVTKNVPNGTTLYWEAVSNSYYDFASNGGYGSFVVNNNLASVVVQVASDDVPEATETFYVEVWDDTYSNRIGTSGNVSIIDFGWNTTINSGWTVGTTDLNGASGWTTSTSRDAFYDGTRYVVCGGDAQFPANDVPIIGYSANAVSWTTVNLSAIFTNNYIECGASNGSGISIVMSNFNAARSSSGNLESWTNISSAIDLAGLSNFQSDIIWNGTYFMATGSGGGANFVRSTDGLTWTGYSGFNSVMTSGATALAANGSTVMAIGGFGEAAISSDHGATWSTVPGFATALATTLLGHGIAYGGGRWVYVGGGSGVFMNSTDGTTWTKRTKPLGWAASGTNKVIYKNGIFVVVGNSNRYVAYSVDGGDTWRNSLAEAPENIWSITADNADTVLVIGSQTSRPSTFTVTQYPATVVKDLAQNTTLTVPAGFAISSTKLFNINTISVTSDVSGWNIVNNAYAISGPLTFEFWVWLNAMPTYTGLAGQSSASSPWSGYSTVTGTTYASDLGLVNVSPSGGTTLLRLTNFGQTPLDMQTGAWNHVAITYTAAGGSQVATFWLNGAWQGGLAPSNYGGEITTFANTLRIGQAANTTTTGFNGLFGQIRLSNVLRYTGSSSITVPTTAWTLDANTVSLISTA